MRKRTQQMRAVVGLLVFLSVVLAGCNIFSWTDGDEASIIDRGLELMRQGNYEGAEQAFAQAMVDDPTSSEARYYHAKAVLGGAGFNILNLIRDISRGTEERHQDGFSLPLYDLETGPANEIYQVNLIIIDDLQPIYSGQTHGAITADDVETDLAIASLLAAALSLRDTNRDGTISEEDLTFDITFSSDLESYTIIGLDQFLGGASVPPPACGRESSISPEEINPFINKVLSLIDASEDIVVSVVRELTGELSLEAIQGLIDDLRNTIVKYYYDDNQDNDADERADEEMLNGGDDDGDGYVDEDTDHV